MESFPEYAVKMQMHVENRSKLIQRFHQLNHWHGTIVIEGGTIQYQYNTDTELPFRQESNFLYLFGIEEPDLTGGIEIGTGKSWLLIPRPNPQTSVWEHQAKDPKLYQDRYLINLVDYIDQFKQYLSSPIWTLPGTKLVSGDTRFLKQELAECRVIKSKLELDLMRYINRITSWAHLQVMHQCQPGMYEYDLEALFTYLTYVNGRCRFLAYPSICAAGPNAAILHYTQNTRKILDGDLVLLDAGAAYHGYCSDVTNTFPVNRIFNSMQRSIYELVLDTSRSVMQALRPGVKWSDLQRLAEDKIGKGLLQLNLVSKLEDRVVSRFFPHGIGHFIGLDTHDTPEIPKDRPFEPGMVVAIEPGIYFNPSLMDHPFINQDLVRSLYSLGGVRIENNLVITATGSELITVLPRTAFLL